MADPKNDGSSKRKSEKMENAGEVARSQSDKDKTAEVLECPPRDNHWVEIRLVGEDGVGIGDTRCIVTAPDGTKHRVKTDAKGVIRLEGIPEGKCKVAFVDMDKNAWEAKA